jgi:lipid A 3-O-deacylase
MLFRFALFTLLGLFYLTRANAQTGVTLTYPLIDKDPSHLQGYRTAFWYQPSSLTWPSIKIYFDVSFGHWWVNNVPANREINIYSIAPTLRYYFTQNDSFSPFFDLSIGASYLTRTRFAERNLGIYFSFQDQIGLGASFGPEQRLSISLSALHYSNGSLAGTNAGITIPLLLNVSYGI